MLRVPSWKHPVLLLTMRGVASGTVYLINPCERHIKPPFSVFTRIFLPSDRRRFDTITYKIDFHVETDPYTTVAGRIA